MDQTKEFSHKNNKTHKKCVICFQSYSCPKCKGLCIFSETILNKYPTSLPVRKMSDQKFFKTEYQLLKTLINGKDPLENYLDLSDEEDKHERIETYLLLQKFHYKLSETQKKLILKAHGSSQTFSPYCQTNKSNKIMKFYHHGRNQKDSKPGSRQQKLSNLVSYSEGNMYFI